MAERGDATMIVFNGIQTPETEVHGELVEEARRACSDHALLFVVDSAAVDEASLSARRESWLSLLGAAVWTDLRRPPQPADLEAAAAAMRGEP